MCHAVKAFGREIEIEDNGNILLYDGLMVEEFKYNENDGLYEMVDEKNVGIEESLNFFDETQIMQIMTGKEWADSGSGYKATIPAVKKIMSFPELAKARRTSQFENPSIWIQQMGKSESENLIRGFDDWILPMQASISELLNRFEEIKKQQKDGISRINHVIEGYEEKRKNESIDKKHLDKETEIMIALNQLDSKNQYMELLEGEIARHEMPFDKKYIEDVEKNSGR